MNLERAKKIIDDYLNFCINHYFDLDKDHPFDHCILKDVTFGDIETAYQKISDSKILLS